MEELLKQLLAETQLLRAEQAKLIAEVESLRTGKAVKIKGRVDIDTVSVAEACEILQMSNSGVRKAIDDGRFKTYKNKGGKTRILIDSLKNL